MAHQVRGFVSHLAAKANVYQLIALGLALGLFVINMPGGGGGGVV